MKSKTLIAVAVASTFGWSAASFAGPSHSVVTPFSPNESGENVFSYQQGFDSSSSLAATGAISDSGSGAVSGSSNSSANSLSMSGNETAAVGTDDSFAAADNGIYSDFYVVGLAPLSDQWDYYVIDDGGTPTVIGLSDYDVWMPSQQLVLIPSTADEMTYDLALVPMTFDESDVTGE